MTLEFTVAANDRDLFLKPGRYQVDADEAKALLVDHPRFEESTTRAEIWSGFEEYMSRFFALEEQFAEILEGESLVHCVWLGGSYVSSRLNPSNIDMSVLVDTASEQKIKGRPKSGWMVEAFSREKIKDRYKVSPLRVPYRLVESVFVSHRLPVEDQDYLRERGAWDDWWQRCRPAGEKTAPMLDTARPRRGYLEVTL